LHGLLNRRGGDSAADIGGEAVSDAANSRNAIASKQRRGSLNRGALSIASAAAEAR